MERCDSFSIKRQKNSNKEKSGNTNSNQKNIRRRIEEDISLFNQ